ncbi:MAG: ectoine hydroxylase-related dioxygenase (phytanoyl-CoA dioxygenase family) [Cocleimonas sp.]|jgi:ectoine hydroxylase-related dioxygenase (phytanoyl-CoA dioxygenase family)
MPKLSSEKIDQFNRDGYMFLENAIDADVLVKLKAEFDQWKEESREHTKAYGNTYDNRPRFDVEPGHSATHPAL